MRWLFYIPAWIACAIFVAFGAAFLFIVYKLMR